MGAAVDYLRDEFPVFEHVAYLNAGTCGPLPGAALRAAADSGLAAAEHGRTRAYFERLGLVREELRGRYARVLGAEPADVALTVSTSDGMARVIAGLGLRAGDEVLTAPDEHPGLLAPLGLARRALGITVRTAPLERIHEAIGPETRLVACSHVSWMTGAVAPAQLAAAAGDVPVLLDGAQGAGAIAIDLAALGCAFYAAAGQKWMCGPMGTGMLWIAPEWRDRVRTVAPTFPNLDGPDDGLDTRLWPDARAHDAPALSAETLAAASAAAGVLEDTGWPAVHERATALAASLAERLAAAGRVVAPRGPTTLVSWEEADPTAAVARCAEAGVAIRALPGTPYARASVGAWNGEDDLSRLLEALG